MLPGYTYIPRTVTKHIHLGAVPYDGSDPTGFGAHGEPPYLIGHVERRTPIYDYQAEFDRAIDGTPFDHSLRDSSGTPIVFRGMQYTVRVSPSDYDLLEHLVKWRVYLVDNLHCPDNFDHTPYIRKMRFEDMTYSDFLEPLLNYQIVTLTFLDMDTVAPI